MYELLSLFTLFILTVNLVLFFFKFSLVLTLCSFFLPAMVFLLKFLMVKIDSCFAAIGIGKRQRHSAFLSKTLRLLLGHGCCWCQRHQHLSFLFIAGYCWCGMMKVRRILPFFSSKLHQG